DEAFQFEECAEALETVIIYAGEPDVEGAERGQLCQVIEGLAGYLGTMQVQDLDVFPVGEMGESIVGKVLCVVKIEVSDVAEVLEVFQANVGDHGVTEVELAEGFDLADAGEVDVGDPG